MSITVIARRNAILVVSERIMSSRANALSMFAVLSTASVASPKSQFYLARESCSLSLRSFMRRETILGNNVQLGFVEAKK